VGEAFVTDKPPSITHKLSKYFALAVWFLWHPDCFILTQDWSVHARAHTMLSENINFDVLTCLVEWQEKSKKNTIYIYYSSTSKYMFTLYKCNHVYLKARISSIVKHLQARVTSGVPFGYFTRFRRWPHLSLHWIMVWATFDTCSSL